jgi:hypothetical protein
MTKGEIIRFQCKTFHAHQGGIDSYYNKTYIILG